MADRVNTKYQISASTPLRSYVWNLLQTELGWNKADTGNLIPVVGSQDQPELQNYDAPYIVYSWSLMPSGENFLMREEQVTMKVYSSREDEVRNAVIMLDNQLNRYDDSARAMNSWLAAHGTTFEKKFDIKYTYTISASGPQPAVQAGGRQDGLVIFRICYTVESDGSGIRS